MEHIIEEWRPVVGWEGKYEISSEGRLKNLSSGIISSGYKTKCGYSYASLYDRDLKKEFSRTIHRLVAHAFIPNPNNLPYVNHKDENKLNNKADNLEWCDGSYNTLHGTAPSRMSTNSGRNKPVAMYDANGVLLMEFHNISAAERHFGTNCHALISNVCKGKKKSYNGFTFRFIEKPKPKHSRLADKKALEYAPKLDTFTNELVRDRERKAFVAGYSASVEDAISWINENAHKYVESKTDLEWFKRDFVKHFDLV